MRTALPQCGLRRTLPACCLLFAATSAVLAGEVDLPGTAFGAIGVKVASLQEIKFRTIVRQQYDFSCGSAAIATLLTHHYRRPTREQDVFREMFERGDSEKIKQHGFSLLDMKNYLSAHGFDADGFEVPLDRLAQERVPAVALLQKEGYRHFVVVKGIDRDDVLVGDPSAGTIVVPREQFASMWNGIAFLIRNHADVGRKSFGRKEDWRVRRKAPVSQTQGVTDAAPLTLVLPQMSDF